MKPEYLAKAAELQGTLIYSTLSVKTRSIDSENHTAVFVMSTEMTDRHGDRVEQSSWIVKYFRGGFFWGHRSNEFPLGKWLSLWLEDDPEIPGKQMLVGKAEYAVELHPDIERAWKHTERGDIDQVSVGFIPGKVEYDEAADVYVLSDCELMECSLVGIGSNRRALIKDTEDVKDIKDSLIDTKKEIEDTEPGTPVEAIRKANALAMLNKAIRQYKK